MISKFILCLLAAGVLGFIIGWMLSSLVRNEKLEEKYNSVKDDFDAKRAELNQTYSDLDAKEEELNLAYRNTQQLQKELLMKNMDIEEYEKNGFISSDTSALELENNTLKEEISEYKYLENENELLHNELKELSAEKEKLLEEIEKNRDLAIQRPQNHKKEKQIHSETSIEDSHIKVLQKDLKKAKRKLQSMTKYLENINHPKKKKRKKKLEKEGDNIMIFDFNKKPLETSDKNSLK